MNHTPSEQLIIIIFFFCSLCTRIFLGYSEKVTLSICGMPGQKRKKENNANELFMRTQIQEAFCFYYHHQHRHYHPISFHLIIIIIIIIVFLLAGWLVCYFSLLFYPCPIHIMVIIKK